ncbi:MAG: universal stress protein UspA [Flavobacteriaceae bacterium TMED212]|nr:MAG: universal stress protein UspA [Flavobacteriaceae bacterium TMED212]|tara:strand:+ start:19592 stop:20452 length:861 start_codon:yes stop_codon:yes gene_type:complete
MSPIAFKKILVGFAFSPNLKANIYEALRMVHYFEGELVFVHVGNKTAEKESRFKEIVASSPVQSEKIAIHWKVGNPVNTLLEASEEFKVDLIVLGALKRENVVKFYMGSIARKITRQANCSVLLLINPSVERNPCQHIVVNGFDSPQTIDTIGAAFVVAKSLGAKKISLVEEISRSKVAVTVDDDRSLRRATLRKEKLRRQEQTRVKDVVRNLPDTLTNDVNWTTQSIFGSRGYSIGHYAKVVRADLLIMNAQENLSFIDRLITRDIEHILAELPTDVLIVNSKRR